MSERLYAPEDKYLWDSWFVRDEEGNLHIFYLQAPRILDPDARHDNATVGHAVSSDEGKSWKEIGTALSTGEHDAWDGLAIWTGSIIYSPLDSKWHMFYTGRGHDDPRAQLIGHAESPDLNSWTKTTVDAPLLAPSDLYSANTGLNAIGGFPAWRDPFLSFNKERDRFEMLITARTADDTPYNACIARAWSKDLKEWTLIEPLLAPKSYEEMECPQLIEHEGNYYLFFNTWERHYSPELRRKLGSKAASGLHAFWSPDLEGEFQPVNGTGVVLGNGKEVYDIRILTHVKGNEYVAVGWANEDEHGRFLGTMSNQFVISIDGSLVTPRS